MSARRHQIRTVTIAAGHRVAVGARKVCVFDRSGPYLCPMTSGAAISVRWLCDVTSP
jgi:hypothetical protein